MSLKDALNGLSNAVEDLTSLQVQTFTGLLPVKLEPGQTDRLSALEQAATGDNASVHLALETFVKADGDTYNFVGDNVSAAVQAVHDAAVQNARETRQGLMEMVSDWVT